MGTNTYTAQAHTHMVHMVIHARARAHKDVDAENNEM